MIAWIEKFVSGFAFWSGQVIGKWIYYAILFIVFSIGWHKVFPAKPPVVIHETRVERVENMVNQAPAAENKKSFFLGLKVWRIGLGAFAE